MSMLDVVCYHSFYMIPKNVFYCVCHNIFHVNFQRRYPNSYWQTRDWLRAAWDTLPPLGSYVFQANVTIFELIQDINETNLLTIHVIHEDWTINVASRELTRQMLTAHDGKK
ncbi:hypothetical protein DPMN_021833 [Dreissena polymorpha]|uniref:Uncharacterized protein n=1 Tax=Dreissena polymorpha TaxID=45954 RepID=A0A9D4NND4_DREPO|nr:hypothetical protein DPMN_021833 [Dreissena polymorpha]